MSGKVWIVGAGPGDPGLITVRGLEALRAADVVLYDRLVAPELLAECRPDAELVYVGKEAEGRHTPQPEITEALIAAARAGKDVVRLKGGDPYLFAHGGEEAVAVAAAGLAFQVVPGVTSAFAVPAAAGIPLSHRDLSSSIAIVTAHRAGDGDLPWQSLAGMDTVVVLMGAARIREVCRRLVAAGRDPDEPAAAIYRGTTARQREVFAPLAGLADAFVVADLGAPSVIVVGAVVGLAGTIRTAELVSAGEGG